MLFFLSLSLMSVLYSAKVSRFKLSVIYYSAKVFRFKLNVSVI